MASCGVSRKLAEMETLAELWAEDIQSHFNSMVHNGKLWDELAVKFVEKTSSLKKKIKRLRKRYRNYKKARVSQGLLLLESRPY